MSTRAGEHVPSKRWAGQRARNSAGSVLKPHRRQLGRGAAEDLHRLDDWDELNELSCPGCAEPVTDEPPTTHQPDEPPLSWSHRDGYPLCGQQPGGGQVEPTQWRQFR